MSERDDTLHAILGNHFVMWHAFRQPLSLTFPPPGEWRCQCGAKFGFSDSAIAHQVDQIVAALDGAR